jgi:alkylated DNA repair protein alkB family protein 6
VNDYSPTEGIMAHTDGPLYWDRTATISMGGDVVLKFRRRLAAEEICGADDDGQQQQYPKLDLLLSGKGSLVLFMDDAYTNHLHSIGEGSDTETTTDCCANAAPGLVVQRSNRISLTFRHKHEEATCTS